MSNQKVVIDLIKKISGQSNVLTIPRIFIHLTGDIKAALFLSQCVYWSDKTKREDGFFYKSADEWEEETGLTRTEQVGARNRVQQFVETRLHRANSAPTLHYRVNFDALANAIFTFYENQKTSNSENMQSDLQEISKSHLHETSKTLTEITHKTTRGAGKKPASHGRQRDERSKHPAILCVKGITGRYPPKSNYDDVITRMGDCPDGKKAAECYKWWTFGGRNQAGLGWLDWYADGIPDWVKAGPAANGKNGGNGNGRSKQKTEVTPAPVGQEDGSWNV